MNMETVFSYQHPYSAVCVRITQVVSALEDEDRRTIFDNTNYDDLVNTISIRFQRLSINDDTSSLDICFSLCTNDLYWYRSVPHDRVQFRGRKTHTKSLHLKLDPSVCMSYDTFYSVMQANLDNWGGEEFDRNYRDVVIHDMIHKVREIVDDESNKDLQYLTVFIAVALTVSHFSDERILFEEELLPLHVRFFNRLVPASKLSMQLLKRMKADENIMNEECVICFEELGKGRELLSMPCSHIFHGNCITNWLENGHFCPICRYKMPT